MKDKENNSITNQNNEPRVFLYGESHGENGMYYEELKAWQYFYNNHKMRHLFIETGYTTAQIMNQWMKANDDALLMGLYENWKETSVYCVEYLDFLRNIKQACPETVFHGTDVGHQYETNDSMLLQQLEKKRFHK